MVKIYNSPYIVIIIYLFAIKLQNKREILSIVLHLSSKTIYFYCLFPTLYQTIYNSKNCLCKFPRI